MGRVRLVKYTVGQTVFSLATTLLDAALYRGPDLARLYHGRWSLEEYYEYSFNCSPRKSKLGGRVGWLPSAFISTLSCSADRVQESEAGGFTSWQGLPGAVLVDRFTIPASPLPWLHAGPARRFPGHWLELPQRCAQ